MRTLVTVSVELACGGVAAEVELEVEVEVEVQSFTPAERGGPHAEPVREEWELRVTLCEDVTALDGALVVLESGQVYLPNARQRAEIIEELREAAHAP
jgi:hypothetical protein